MEAVEEQHDAQKLLPSDVYLPGPTEPANLEMHAAVDSQNNNIIPKLTINTEALTVKRSSANLTTSTDDTFTQADVCSKRNRSKSVAFPTPTKTTRSGKVRKSVTKKDDSIQDESIQ